MRQPSPTTTDGTLLSLRFIYASLALAIVLYVLVMKLTPPKTAVPINPLIPLVLGFVAATNLGAGQTIRSRKIPPAFDTLRAKPDDLASLTQWRTGAMISACLAESVALFGVVVYFLGGRVIQVAPFLVGGLAALIFWWPKRP